MTTKTEASKVSRRQFLRGVAGGVALAGAGTLGGVYFSEQARRQRHQELFGTRAEPKFSITKQVDKADVSGFRDVMAAAKTRLETAQALNDDLRKAVSSIALQLKDLTRVFNENPEMAEQAAIYQEMARGGDPFPLIRPEHHDYAEARLVLRSLDTNVMLLDVHSVRNRIVSQSGELSNRIDRSLLDLTIQAGSAEELVACYGLPEEYAKRIFRDLTGKDLPASVELSIKDFEDPHIMGWANPMRGEVAARDSHYARLVHVYSHELGHIICQQDEELFFSGGDPTKRDHVWLLEEAAAFSFQRAAATVIPDEELRKVALGDFANFSESMLSHFYSTDLADRQTDLACHAEALAISDAALTVFASQTDAFNHLATAEKIDQRIIRVMERNRQSWQRIQQELNLTQEERNRLCQQISEMREQISSLQEKFDFKPKL